jgi:lysophospholipase L1-like esterase
MTWVGNGGIPRHSADSHLLFVREVLSKIKPDMALFLTGVNDMGPFLRGSAAESQRLPDSGLRQALFSHSMVLQLIYKMKVVYIDGAPVISNSVDPYFQEIPMNEEEAVLPDDLHDLLENPNFYRHRIRALIQECRSLNITPVFMTQPLLYENNDHWRGILEGSRWLGDSESPMSAAVFSLMLDMLNQDLIQVCSEEGVAVFDLSSEIPHTREYFYDTMHMTEAGARLTGEKAAAFLLERKEMLWPED